MASREPSEPTDAQPSLLAQLHGQPARASRNRHFDFFQQPAARRARRLLHFLQSVERDLLSAADGGAVEVHRLPRGSRVSLELRFPRLEGTRTAFLHPEEFALLLRNPACRSLLSHLLDEETA